MKSHKFGIKKAYTYGNYFLILDQDNILTVRKQSQIQQCFTDIEDIVAYQNFIIQPDSNQNQLQSSIKGFSQQSSTSINSKIFILLRKKPHSNIKKTQKQQKLSYHSQLIALRIRESISSNNKLLENQEVQYRSVVVSNKGKLFLSPNGRWAKSEESFILIQIKESPQNFCQNKRQSEFILNLTSIDKKFLSYKTEKSILNVIQFRKVNQNLFSIIYLNSSFEICSCSFEYEAKKSTTQIVSLKSGDIIQSIHSSDSIICCFPTSNIQLPHSILVLFDQSLKIYSLDTLKFISQVSLSSLAQHQISKKCKSVYLDNWQIWLFDPLDISLHKLNIQKIIKQQILKPLLESFNPLSEELSKSHINTSKLLNLRLRILKLLQNFLQGNYSQRKIYSQGQIHISTHFGQKVKAKSADFSSCLRLLSKEQNISILNDGVSYLINFILTKFQKSKKLQALLSINLTIESLEESLVKLLSRLILSKYQSHVQNGLDLLLKIFNFFNQKSNNKPLYKKIAQSSRIHKLLQQEKKQKLWELAYMFTMKLQVSIN